MGDPVNCSWEERYRDLRDDMQTIINTYSIDEFDEDNPWSAHDVLKSIQFYLSFDLASNGLLEEEDE